MKLSLRYLALCTLLALAVAVSSLPTFSQAATIAAPEIEDLTTYVTGALAIDPVAATAGDDEDKLVIDAVFPHVLYVDTLTTYTHFRFKFSHTGSAAAAYNASTVTAVRFNSHDAEIVARVPTLVVKFPVSAAMAEEEASFSATVYTGADKDTVLATLAAAVVISPAKDAAALPPHAVSTSDVFFVAKEAQPIISVSFLTLDETASAARLDGRAWQDVAISRHKVSGVTTFTITLAGLCTAQTCDGELIRAELSFNGGANKFLYYWQLATVGEVTGIFPARLPLADAAGKPCVPYTVSLAEPSRFVPLSLFVLPATASGAKGTTQRTDSAPAAGAVAKVETGCVRCPECSRGKQRFVIGAAYGDHAGSVVPDGGLVTLVVTDKNDNDGSGGSGGGGLSDGVIAAIIIAVLVGLVVAVVLIKHKVGQCQRRRRQRELLHEGSLYGNLA